MRERLRARSVRLRWKGHPLRCEVAHELSDIWRILRRPSVGSPRRRRRQKAGSEDQEGRKGQESRKERSGGIGRVYRKNALRIRCKSGGAKQSARPLFFPMLLLTPSEMRPPNSTSRTTPIIRIRQTLRPNILAPGCDEIMRNGPRSPTSADAVCAQRKT